VFIIVIIFYFKRLLGYYVLCNATKNNCFDSYNAEIQRSRRGAEGEKLICLTVVYVYRKYNNRVFDIYDRC